MVFRLAPLRHHQLRDRAPSPVPSFAVAYFGVVRQPGVLLNRDTARFSLGRAVARLATPVPSGIVRNRLEMRMWQGKGGCGGVAE